MSHHRRSRWRDGTALATLTLASLAFFWKILLTNRILAGLDVLAYFYPYRAFASESLRAGTLPLWNPHLFMGAPFLANSQAAVLYPLHWPLAWLPAPKQIAWSIGLHIVLAAWGTYLFSRSALRLQRQSSWLAAGIFAFGGFLGAQAEHINQLNASVWLPWLLFCVDASSASSLRRWSALLLGGLVVCLTLLAGHTQAAYIVLFGAALYAMASGLGPVARGSRLAALRTLGWRRALLRLIRLGGMVLIGATLAAAQLAPTVELSGLSVRAGGLPYREAVSFSLQPALLFKALLPPLAWPPPFSEYVAYIGLSGLGLALVGTWSVVRRRGAGVTVQEERSSRIRRLAVLGLAGLGLFLSFGAYNPLYYILFKTVPGFALFRAPARWLLLYGFGFAVMSGVGLDVLAEALRGQRWPQICSNVWSRFPRLRPASLWAREQQLAAISIAVVALVMAELLVARRELAYNNPTAPAAFESSRSAPSHLLADNSGQPFRFLSLSDIEFDPGDMVDLLGMYAEPLKDRAAYDLIVATKMKEVLAYNLPMYYGLGSVDGYDGGLLPVASYVMLEHLFLPEDLIWPDGRLRQQLREIPANNLLSLLNVKYVITDKLQDAWIDDVFYDLQHTVTLQSLTLTDLPPFPATHLGVVSHLVDASSLPQGTPVAELSVACAEGPPITATLRAGIDTAETRYDTLSPSHSRARLARQQLETAQATNEYISVLPFDRACYPKSIEFRTLLSPDGPARTALRGLTLIDQRTGTSNSVSVDPAYRLVHSGDVKIYENLNVLPRAFIVHQASRAADDQAALDLMSDPGFAPSRDVILAESGTADWASQEGRSEVTVIAHDPESVRVQAELGAPGFLVLTDANYPGWQAFVDESPAELLRADLYFRAVPLRPGRHTVEFYYRPASVCWGIGISATAALLWCLAASAIAMRLIGRKRQTDVE